MSRSNDTISGIWLPVITPFLEGKVEEANQMPIKYALWKRGLIGSPECRLPLTRISRELAGDLDQVLPALTAEPAGERSVRR